MLCIHTGLEVACLKFLEIEIESQYEFWHQNFCLQIIYYKMALICHTTTVTKIEASFCSKKILTSDEIIVAIYVFRIRKIKYIIKPSSYIFTLIKFAVCIWLELKISGVILNFML